MPSHHHPTNEERAPTDDGGDRLQTLEQYIQPILGHRRLVAAVTVGTLTAGVIAGAVAPTSYRSTASILVTPISGDPTKALESGDIKVDMPTELRIATSQAVVNLVSEDLASDTADIPPDVLADSVTATSPQDSRILDYGFEAPTPDLATAGANSFADTYLTYRTELANAEQEAAQTAIQERITTLKERLSDAEQALAGAAPGSQAFVEATVEKTSVEGELTALQTALADLSTLTVDAGEVIDQASRPESPEGLGWIQIVIGSLISGLVLGVLTAYTWAAIRWGRRRDRRSSDRANAPAPPDDQAKIQPAEPIQPVDHRETDRETHRDGVQAEDVNDHPGDDRDGAIVSSSVAIVHAADLIEATPPAPLLVQDDYSGLIGELRTLGATSSVTALCIGDDHLSALNLGFELGDALHGIGARVLLVDAVGPGGTDGVVLHSLLGFPAGPGLVDILAGRASLFDVTRPLEGMAGVHALTNGSHQLGRPITDGPAFELLLTEAKTRYHAVLIIGGGTENVDLLFESSQLAELADGVAVGSQLPTGVPIEAKLQDWLDDIPVPAIGVVTVGDDPGRSTAKDDNHVVGAGH